jgi:hypothetical protein
MGWKLARRLAIALAVFRMRAPILASVVAMALRPRALRPGLVLAVVGNALPLALLPASPSRGLTVRNTAVRLMRDLWTRPECLAALPWMPSPSKGNLSEARPAPGAYNLDGEGNPRPQPPSSSLQRQRPHRAAPIRPVDADRVGGSIPVSTPGSILVSVKADPAYPRNPPLSPHCPGVTRRAVHHPHPCRATSLQARRYFPPRSSISHPTS